MSSEAWVTLGGVLSALLIQALGFFYYIGRTFERGGRETDEKLANERLERVKALSAAVQTRTEEMERLNRAWVDSQGVQDRNVGELGISLRTHIKDIEKKIYETELWGRDNYVHQKDLARIELTIDRLSADIIKRFDGLEARLMDDLSELKEDLKSA